MKSLPAFRGSFFTSHIHYLSFKTFLSLSPFLIKYINVINFYIFFTFFFVFSGHKDAVLHRSFADPAYATIIKLFVCEGERKKFFDVILRSCCSIDPFMVDPTLINALLLFEWIYRKKYYTLTV